MAHLRPPPLLLTKRLTSFLQLNLSPQITTLLLLTSDGKLLAYASQPPIPVVTLRTHGTVAASLYAIHSNGADQDTIDAALPPGSRARRASRGSGSGSSKSDGPLAVTIQLESGTVLVIRRLRCGMLFVCMGPPAGNDAQGSRPGTQHQHQQQGGQTSQLHQLHHPPQGSQQNLRPPQAADDASAGGANGHTPASSPPQPQPPPTTTAHPPSALPPLGSPPETASIRSAATGVSATSTSSAVFGAGTAGVVATRRHAEELARWLDDKLGALDVPDDGLAGVVG
jgi:hypothetical protein